MRRRVFFGWTALVCWTFALLSLLIPAIGGRVAKLQERRCPAPILIAFDEPDIFECVAPSRKRLGVAALWLLLAMPAAVIYIGSAKSEDAGADLQVPCPPLL